MPQNTHAPRSAKAAAQPKSYSSIVSRCNECRHHIRITLAEYSTAAAASDPIATLARANQTALIQPEKRFDFGYNDVFVFQAAH